LYLELFIFPYACSEREDAVVGVAILKVVHLIMSMRAVKLVISSQTAAINLIDIGERL